MQWLLKKVSKLLSAWLSQIEYKNPCHVFGFDETDLGSLSSQIYSQIHKYDLAWLVRFIFHKSTSITQIAEVTQAFFMCEWWRGVFKELARASIPEKKSRWRSFQTLMIEPICGPQFVVIETLSLNEGSKWLHCSLNTKQTNLGLSIPRGTWSDKESSTHESRI